MYHLIIHKTFSNQEYKLQTAADVCDLIFKIANSEHHVYPYHLYWYESWMTERFNLSVRASDLPINEFNRKMLRRRRDFETELMKRVEMEKVANIQSQELLDIPESETTNTKEPETNQESN